MNNPFRMQALKAQAQPVSVVVERASGDGAMLDRKVAVLFGLFDSNGDGAIDESEARRIAQIFAFNPNTFWQTMKKYDRNGDGLIQYSEFAVALKSGFLKVMGLSRAAMLDEVEEAIRTLQTAPPAIHQATSPQSRADSAGGASSSGQNSKRLSKKRSSGRVRRVAIVGESTEKLSSMRWQSAYDALRRAEPKDAAQVAQIIATLKANRAFSSLTSAHSTLLERIADAMRSCAVASGQLVIQQGETGDAFYVVVDGSLEAYVGDDPTRPVRTFGAGDSFGELALLYSQPRNASVRCTSARGARLFKLGRIHFRNLVSGAMRESRELLERQLAGVAELTGLGEAAYTLLAEAVSVLTFQPGAKIVEVGAPADALFIVLSGEVAWSIPGEHAELRLREGAVFGESCFAKIANHQREANVSAVGKVRCAQLLVADCVNIVGPLEAAAQRSFCRKVMDSMELFTPLSSGERNLVLSASRTIAAVAGQVLLEQGVVGDTFFIILRGSVDVLQWAESPHDADGEGGEGGEGGSDDDDEDGSGWQHLISLSVPSYFGERSLLTAEKTVARVVAASDVELLAVAKADFDRVLGRSHALVNKEIARRDAMAKSIRMSNARGWRKLVAADAAKLQRPPPNLWHELELREQLGQGAFGSVCLAVHRPTGERHALKRLKKAHLAATGQVANTVHEKKLLGICDHPFIAKCRAAFHSKAHACLLLDLARGGELYQRIQQAGTLGDAEAAHYVAIVASALGYLSSRCIAYRDLKPENLLLDGVGYLTLVDFGLAKQLQEAEDRTYTFCGTPDYLAPEVLEHSGHHWGVDWWGLGVLLFEMLHGEPPFYEEEQLDSFDRIAMVQYWADAGIAPAAKDLIGRLLVHSPAKRLGMLVGGVNDVFAHPFCAHIDVNKMLHRELHPPFEPPAPDVATLQVSATGSAATDLDGDEPPPAADPKNDAIWEREFGPMVG